MNEKNSLLPQRLAAAFEGEISLFRIIRPLLENTVLMATVVSWMSAQLIKTLLTFVSTKKFDVERMFGAGGMPSAHSAMVCSLAMGVAHTCRINSPEFAMSVAFAGVVIYDAMGVRRAAGEHAKVINRLVDTLESNDITDSGQKLPDKELNEYIGHKPAEVLAGALLGIIIWMLFLLFM